MKVLLVGESTSPFLINFATWLKKTRPEIIVHVFPKEPLKKEKQEYAYDKILLNKFHSRSFWCRIKFIGVVIQPFLMNYALRKQLKKTKSQYDIIHFNRVFPSIVLTPSYYKKYSKKNVVTFWGSEPETQKILFSNSIYRKYLLIFLNQIDAVIGSSKNQYYCSKLLPDLSSKYYWAKFGSVPMEYLIDCLQTKSKREAKQFFGIDTELISVVIGYSGKSLHNHKKVILALMNSKYYAVFKKKIQIVVPMSYGCGADYAKSIRSLLIKSGFSFKLFHGTYWSDEDVACFRQSTDIVLQLSSSDAASSSIIEFLSAGAVMISGEWLPYHFFKDLGFKFVEVATIEDAGKELDRILHNWEKSKMVYSSQDHEKIISYTWGHQIHNWVEAYYKVLEQ